MKKNYLMPIVETLDVRSTFTICEGTGGGNIVIDEGNVFVPGGGNAPSRRKPF